jgi:hypothetical protein
LPSSPEQSEHPNTMPPPELNPLLNPILGENMSRWAEVYFTNPPERREQAVLELLQELQTQNVDLDNVAVNARPSVQEKRLEPAIEPATDLPEVQKSLVRCEACGRENPASHRFCGMCGRPVAEQGSAPEPAPAPVVTAPIEHHAADPVSHEPEQHQSAPPLPVPETFLTPPEEADYQPVVSGNELSLFQLGNESRGRFDDADELFSTEPASRSYRPYIGVGLAIVIFALAYTAWRNGQTTSQNSHVQPQAPPAIAAQESSPETAPPSTAKAATPDGFASSDKHSAIPSDSERVSESAPVKNRDSKKQDQPLNTRGLAKNAPETESRNGSAELLIAQGYLTGANGEPRNGAEAAKWLWKSMAKHNSTATLTLADLYLKGDGVAKNCDQARILLDSAAREGMKQAGEQLRHLQAFGCE